MKPMTTISSSRTPRAMAASEITPVKSMRGV
jgi:hypothetical protein